MTDYNIWKNDIKHRFPRYITSHTTVGSGFTAKAIVVETEHLVTTSSYRLSIFDAYNDLRQKLLDGAEGILPKSTTAQRDALKGIIDGTLMLNITTGTQEICNNSIWSNVAGVGLMSKTAYGSMFQHNHLGDNIHTTSKKWVTASAGKVDSNSLITVVDDSTNGDHLLVGVDGAGDYMILATCDVTNSGNNETILEVIINNTVSTDLEDKEDTSSTKPRGMSTHGIHALSAGDKISLKLESTTPANIIKVFDCHLSINRIS